MIKCKICGKNVKYAIGKFKPKPLFIHIGRVHHIVNYQYVKQYEHVKFQFKQCGWCYRDAIPDIIYENKELRLTYKRYLCDNEACKKERKKCNPRSYYATMRTYKMTEKEAREFVSSKSPFHRNYFESEEEYALSQTKVSLSQFQKRHGKRKGLKKFQEYQKLRQYINSLQYYIDQYGEEGGRQKWQEFNKSKAITRQKMIDKYGEKEGNKRYDSFLDKTLKNFVSKMSLECLDYVSEQCQIQIRHGGNNSEKKIRCAISTHPVDGFCQDLNIAFEFYGDRWHMNPAMFTSEDLNPRKKGAKEIWKEDRIRLNDILPEVNSIFIIWENDWNHHAKRIILRLKRLLSKLKSGSLNKAVYYL